MWTSYYQNFCWVLISSKCCAGTSLIRNIPSQMLLDNPKSFLDLKSSHDSLGWINFGQLNFRQKGRNKNHTRLGPHGLSVIYGFVFTSDQSVLKNIWLGSKVGTHFPHGFGVYLSVFRVYPRVQQLSQTLHQMYIPNK